MLDDRRDGQGLYRGGILVERLPPRPQGQGTPERERDSRGLCSARSSAPSFVGSPKAHGSGRWCLEHPDSGVLFSAVKRPRSAVRRAERHRESRRTYGWVAGSFGMRISFRNLVLRAQRNTRYGENKPESTVLPSGRRAPTSIHVTGGLGRRPTDAAETISGDLLGREASFQQQGRTRVAAPSSALVSASVGGLGRGWKGCRSGTHIRRHARKIKNDYTGDAANAHYHRYREDVALEDRVHKKLEEWRVCPRNLPVLGGAGTGVSTRGSDA